MTSEKRLTGSEYTVSSASVSATVAARLENGSVATVAAASVCRAPRTAHRCAAAPKDVGVDGCGASPSPPPPALAVARRGHARDVLRVNCVISTGNRGVVKPLARGVLAYRSVAVTSTRNFIASLLIF